MELRIPDGSASLFDWLGADATDLVLGSVGGGVGGEVTAAQLDEAIASLGRGDIEYVGLHEGDAFLQVAGSGRGPYLIEYHPGPGGVAVGVPAGVTDEAVRYALQAFLARDPAWAQPFPWQPLS